MSDAGEHLSFMDTEIGDLLRPIAKLGGQFLMYANLPGAELRLVITIGGADLSIWLAGRMLLNLSADLKSQALADGGGS